MGRREAGAALLGAVDLLCSVLLVAAYLAGFAVAIAHRHLGVASLFFGTATMFVLVLAPFFEESESARGWIKLLYAVVVVALTIGALIEGIYFDL